MNILIDNFNYRQAFSMYKEGDCFTTLLSKAELHKFIREAAVQISGRKIHYTQSGSHSVVPEVSHEPKRKKFLQVMRLHQKASTETMNYRRFNLNKWLNRWYPGEVDTLYSIADLWKYTDTTYDAVIVSSPLFSDEWMPFVRYDKLFFDRSDDWTSMHPERPFDELRVIEAADKISYTSRTMEKAYPCESKYITNGLNVIPYRSEPKFEKKTAVYIGRNNNKIDFEKIFTLARKNPAWNILIYSGADTPMPEINEPNVHYMGYVDERSLQIILRKCHVGLIPFIKSDTTAAMAPLKVYHYANAHIPVLYSHSPHCEKLPFCFEWHSVKSLDEVFYDGDYDSYYRDWKDIFRELLCFYEAGNAMEAPDHLPMNEIKSVRKTGNTFKISWKMTDACNLSCPYCYMYNAVHRRNPTTPLSDLLKYASRIDSIIDRQAKGRKVSLHLIGGEPAAFYNLWEILDKIKSPLLHKIIVATNFTRPKEYWQSLKAYCKSRNIMCCIIASFHLDQVDPDKWMDKAIEMRAAVKCVMNHENIEKYRPYLERAKKAGLTIEPTIERDDTNSCLEMTKEEKDYIRSLYDYNKRHIYYVVETNDGKKYGFKSNIQMINATIGFDTEGFYCSSGLSGIRINPNGTVQRAGCRHASIHKIGHILDEDLLEKLPTEPWICHTHESDSNGVYKEKNCTAFINSDMWRE